MITLWAVLKAPVFTAVAMEDCFSLPLFSKKNEDIDQTTSQRHSLQAVHKIAKHTPWYKATFGYHTSLGPKLRLCTKRDPLG